MILLTETANWSHIWMVTLIGFALVVCLMLILVLVLKLFGIIMKPRVRVPKVVHTEEKSEIKHDETVLVNLPANTTAAIAMALHLYYADIHDNEAHVMTIKKVERRYSPWHSKINGINNLVK